MFPQMAAGHLNVGLAAKFGRGKGKFAHPGRAFVCLEAACQPGRFTETEPPLKAFFVSAIQMSWSARLAFDCWLFGNLLSTLAVLCTQQR